MNPKELRLGNLIHRIDDDGDKYEHPVLMVGAKGIVMGTKQAPIYTLFNEFIQPIPITEDWLKRLGFNPDKSMGRGAIFEFAEKFTCHFFKGESCIWIEQYSEGEHPLPHIKYIHQLQNLYFALTGEELEIK